jgi:two-component system NtrC family sensor kinase
MFKSSLRTKLTLSFSLVIIAGVFLSAVVGVHIIGNTIIQQAQDKVRLDINSAREVYQHESEKIKNVVRLTASRFFMKNAIIANDEALLARELCKIRDQESLDFLTLTDETGRVIVNSCDSTQKGYVADDEMVSWVIREHDVCVSTVIMSAEDLAREGKGLADQARIELIPTPKARMRSEVEETSGMVIKAVAPVFDYDGDFIGILYGGELLNRNYEIVDKVKDIVYRGEQYEGKDIGTATIFLGDLRISTNVVRSDGTRAIGTRVSQEVYEQVIEQGLPWIGRAFVVNDWYRTAYEPIKDSKGDIIGMLYVGMLEQPYVDLKNRVLVTFLVIAFLSVVLLSVIAYFSTLNIIQPVKKLLFATERVGQGDLAYRVDVSTGDEIGRLGDSFNNMTAELQRATEGYLSLTRTLEQKIQEKTKELEKTQDYLIQSEKLASLGKLAAGIAHEINNPLTSIMINSHLLFEKITDDNIRRKLKLIIDETSRCSTIVKGLLQFSRQSAPEKKLVDLNELIENTLILFESQVIVSKVEVVRNLKPDLPMIMLDENKIRQVFTNVIVNALDAMPDGGTLTIATQLSKDGAYVETLFKDTGCGISKDVLSKIFDPFFSTKKTKGTGLGLSVSYGIIKQHEGFIDVQSGLDKGTAVTVKLPVGSAAILEEQAK